MKDTLRILVDWKCNLKCPYCCNEQERFRKDILPVKLEDIDFFKYENFCISGGEPLLRLDLIGEITKKIPWGCKTILYTNGILLTRKRAHLLDLWAVNAINIGLHYPKSFHKIIRRVTDEMGDIPIPVRFHVWEGYRSMDLERQHPRVELKYWKMDDCDRENEDRVVLV